MLSVFIFLLHVYLVVCRNVVSDNNDGKLKLVIDQDGGADDAMAIFMAALYQRYFGGPQLVALTTTFGNVDEEQAFTNTQLFLDIVGRRDVLIYRGSTSPLINGTVSDYFFGGDGIGDNGYQSFRPLKAQHQHAALALIELSHKYKDNLVVVAIGSLTNIALAIKLDPEFLNRLGHLYVGGGHIKDEKNKDPEFNVAMDPEAYYIVTRNGRPDKLTLIPFSTILTYQTFSKDWRLDVLGAIPTTLMQKQNSFERTSLYNSTSWSLLDPAVMGIVLDYPDIVEEAKDADSIVVLCGSERGITTYDFTNAANATAKVVTIVKKEPYQDLLLKIFSAELNKNTKCNTKNNSCRSN